MVKAELIKFIKSKLLFIVAAVIVALCVYEVINFNNNFKYGSGGSGYDIRGYQTMDDVSELLAETDEAIAELEIILNSSADNGDYGELLSELKTERNIYAYILENDIQYSDYNDYAYIRRAKYDSAFGALESFFVDLNYFLPFILAAFAAVIMPIDFHIGTYKIIYSTSARREKTAAARYTAWLLVAVISALAACSAMAALAFMFGGAEGAVILANVTTVFRVNYFELFLLETVNVLLRTVIVGTIIFAVSLMVKNIIVPLFADVAWCVGGYLAWFSKAPFLNVLLNGYMHAFSGVGASTIYILYYVLAVFAIVAVAGCVGLALHLKRDFS